MIRIDELTPHQLEVIIFAADGYANKQIATEMGLSIDTVKEHFKNVARKLGTHNRTHTVAEAFRAGIIS